VTPPFLLGAHVVYDPFKKPDRKGLQPAFGLPLD
jgi:hypothetical protein